MTSSTTEGSAGPGAERAGGVPDRGSEATLLDIGRVVKPHGLDGEVVVQLWSDRDERLHPGACFASDVGELRIEAVRPHAGRHLVRFAGVSSRSAADALRGVVFRAPPVEVQGALWVHELVGSPVVTVDGRELGSVVAVEANPASDLLVLDGGGLVPLRFVTSFRPGEPVTVDVPDGLLE